MNSRAIRLILPLGAALAASSMISATLTAPASASSARSSAASSAPGGTKTGDLSPNSGDAKAIATRWTSAKLKSAKNYLADSSLSGRLSAKANKASADGGSGTVAPTGSGSNSGAGKSRNVNLPKTVGKVFFEVNGKPYWCSGSAIDSRYRNLVATAGHCVYDTDANTYVDNFVFIPGYYKGKAPWGIYVGAKVNLNDDFTIYEDYDHDYAFVNVYNGIKQTGEQKVDQKTFDAWKGSKYTKKVEITRDECRKVRLNLGQCFVEGKNTRDADGGPATPGAVVTAKETDKATYDKAGIGKGIGNKFGEPVTQSVTKDVFDAYEKTPGHLGTTLATNQGYFITRYYIQRWVVPGTKAKYYVLEYYIKIFTDAGRLSDNVGGQGFAWNQKIGKKVFVFGYPTAPHLDGNKPYSGETQKWCYGTTKRAPVVSKYSADEQTGIKCAFTPGASGGPFLLQYRNSTRVGYLNGVVSLTVDTNANDRYDTVTTPYFDGDTYGVYNHARNLWTGKLNG
jgi:V8-like Glu-specific endopeptidase